MDYAKEAYRKHPSSWVRQQAFIRRAMRTRGFGLKEIQTVLERAAKNWSTLVDPRLCARQYEVLLWNKDTSTSLMANYLEKPSQYGLQVRSLYSWSKHAKLGSLQRMVVRYKGIACAAMFTQGFPEWRSICSKMNSSDDFNHFLESSCQSDWGLKQLDYLEKAFECKSLFQSYYSPAFFPFLSKYVKCCDSHNRTPTFPEKDLRYCINSFGTKKLKELLDNYNMHPLVQSFLLATIATDNVNNYSETVPLVAYEDVKNLLPSLKEWNDKERAFFVGLWMSYLDATNVRLDAHRTEYTVSLLTLIFGDNRRSELQNVLDVANCVGKPWKESMQKMFLFIHQNNTQPYELPDSILM